MVTAPPGRLAPADATEEITGLFPQGYSATDPTPLAIEVITRLRSSFEASGFSADLHGVSLLVIEQSGRPRDAVVAYVIEVRNREESGDDSTPGYDLIITMERSDAGNWTVTKAEKQRICSRGVSNAGDLQLCV